MVQMSEKSINVFEILCFLYDFDLEMTMTSDLETMLNSSFDFEMILTFGLEMTLMLNWPWHLTLR